MVTRIGHIALHVSDLDRAVEFQQQVVGMVETERLAGASYLTCNDRHHELILIEDRANRGYEHIGLEVAGTRALDGAARRLTAHTRAAYSSGRRRGPSGSKRAKRWNCPTARATQEARSGCRCGTRRWSILP